MSLIFLAVLSREPDRDTLGLGRLSPQMSERLIMMAAIGAVALSAIAWAALVRRRKRPKRRHIKPDRFSLIGWLRRSWKDWRLSIARRGERKRIRHRPRNPTRAEVGGLPPVRDKLSPDDQTPEAGRYY